ncbi:hypothetical protein SASPL_143808 [Salvia splendens]|uniref:Uncharacterized protein n=1 Tax=Salvia splendens TaxID=180675 RepID=A0A8X8WP24_SALSN|nr:hypothetical protein SASPL_143808 [Salvia splendens]
MYMLGISWPQRETLTSLFRTYALSPYSSCHSRYKSNLVKEIPVFIIAGVSLLVTIIIGIAGHDDQTMLEATNHIVFIAFFAGCFAIIVCFTTALNPLLIIIIGVGVGVVLPLFFIANYNWDTYMVYDLTALVLHPSSLESSGHQG